MASWMRACVCVLLFLFVSSNYATAQEDDHLSDDGARCGPRNTVCPPVPALGETVHIDLRKQSLGNYIVKGNGPLDWDLTGNGLVLLVTRESSTPSVKVPKHIFFGRVDVEMRSAPGAGIVTFLTLDSPDGDNVGFEWMGANDEKVKTTTLSKGRISPYKYMQNHPIEASSTNFHTYSFLWGTRSLQWFVDGSVVRTLNYRKEDDGTNIAFPQAPMGVSIGCTVLGQGIMNDEIISSVGGIANFTDGPKRAYIKTINITDDAYNSPGRQPKYYTWEDKTGLYTSIGVKYEDSVQTNNGTNGTAKDTTVTNPEATGDSTVRNLETTFTTNGLGTGRIVGIVAGFVTAISMIGTLAAVVVAQRRKRAKQDEDAAASARDLKLGNMSAEKVGGVDNKPELDGCVLVELSSYKDEEAQELYGKGDARLEMSENNNPQEMSPVGSDESEDVYYEKLRSMSGLKKPRGDPQDGKEEEHGKPGADNGSNV